MDILLQKVTQQAMNYAIRSGITITTGFAIRECSRLLKSVKGRGREEIASLQERLESKIRIISPAIDMIELIAARGNTSLDSAVALTKAIRYDIQTLGLRLAKAATEEELLRRNSSRARSQAQVDAELKGIVADITKLLDRIEDAVPLINLAITTSGVNLSTSLPPTVSPSRLLQASTFLSAGDSQYTVAPCQAVQIGPAFVLSLYMLFAGHANRLQDEESIRETTWKEVIHKARVKILRVPLESISDLPSDESSKQRTLSGGEHSDGPHAFEDNVPSEGKAYEFAYQLLIVEDLNDERMHTFDENEGQPGPYDDVSLAGIREVIPIHEVSKIFYADTGKILNIGADGDTNNPVLLLKRDVNAVPPRRMIAQKAIGGDLHDEDEDDDKSGRDNQLRRESSIAPEAILPVKGRSTSVREQWRFPHDLDPEWIAFEVYVEEPDSDDDSSTLSVPPEDREPNSNLRSSLPGLLSSPLAGLTLRNSSPGVQNEVLPAPQAASHVIPAMQPETPIQARFSSSTSALPALKTSLSLLELLIRLTALQQFQQASHLTITDELLNFFLSESSTTGAGADSEYRKRVRRDARRRVGFDPYDESPIKLHGEDYQRRAYADGTDGYSDYAGGYSQAGYTPPNPRTGSPDLAWRYASAAQQSPSPYPASMSHPPSSPSPSLRRMAQERAMRASTTTDIRSGKNAEVLASPTPQSSGMPRKEPPVKREAVGRSQSDSTLGTSPRTADIAER